MAHATLRAGGVANLQVPTGGVAAWIAAGYSVRSPAPRMSIERQVRIAAGALALTVGGLAPTAGVVSRAA